MKDGGGFIIFLCIASLIMLWFVDDEDYKAIPEDISFAESVCKEGDWRSVDKSEVICKDGAIYKREEKQL